MRFVSIMAPVIVAALTLFACGDPDSPSGGPDGGMTALDTAQPSIDTSGPSPDGPSPRCVVDEDCADEVYCDGAELCRPMSTDADGRGCVAGPPPCETTDACNEDDDVCDEGCVDQDGDGRRAAACGGDDCDDTDALRFPGAVEVCDSEAHDEDCNSETFGFVDADADGAASETCCNVGEGGSLVCGADCNDGNAGIGPTEGDGPPLFCDGVDNDCSGTADEGCPCVEGESRACGSPQMMSGVGVCRPGGQVCSGGTFGDTCLGGVPPSEELCDTADNDCDGMTDENVLRRYYPDVDGDGFGDVASLTVEPGVRACSAPAGHASNATDCNDVVASVNPGATEVCNTVDDNCVRGIDEGFVATFYRDTDGDGFGDPAMSMMVCLPPAGYVRGGTDCDDTRNAINPAALEICDGRDNDCDARTDEGVLRTFYRDADRDSFGLTSMTMMACAAPAGYADRDGDCDDTRSGTNPSAPDLCNGIDDNCADGADVGCDCTDGARRDCGSTEVGACAFGAQLCIGGRWGDCIGSIEPTMELCNTVDDDCDGPVDDGVVVSGCLRDADGDGAGAAPASSQCRDATRPGAGFCPVGYTTTGGDCNDTNGTVEPGNVEVCNGIDDNCVMGADEGLLVDCFVDGDSDGFGAMGGVSTDQCRDPARASVGFCPAGYSNVATDCGDSSATVRPGGTESCNGVNDDCDGATDEGVRVTFYRDVDMDGFGTSATTMLGCTAPAGYVPVAGDCNDGNAAIRPGATEACNGVDDNCTLGVTDEPVRTFYRDADTDFFGTTTMAMTACTPPLGYVEYGGDCNDASSAVRPGATEVCNAVDDDCDSMTDDGAAPQCAGANPLAINVTSWACTAGACVPACAGAFRNCDGSLANGCETDRLTSVSHCGACNVACGTGGTCGAGVCDTLVGVEAGGHVSCALRSNGRVACWGNGAQGQLNNLSLASSNVPVVLPDVLGATDIAIGSTFTSTPVTAAQASTLCYVAPGPRTLCWGDNTYAQIGNGTTGGIYSTPVVLPVSMADVAIGPTHSAATTGAAVYGWGDNFFDAAGQFMPASLFQDTPNFINEPINAAVEVTAGLFFSCYLALNGGQIRCWGGRDSFGVGGGNRLGDGAMTGSTSTPVVVTLPGGFVPDEVDAGHNHACARSTANAVACWGAGENGRLGTGSTADRTTPLTITGTYSVVAAGNAHTCAVRTAGTVACWGLNAQGQLGDASTTDRLSPTTVGTLAGATDVAAGAAHACALVGQDVYCWGYNRNGQLGNGTTVDSLVPVLVSGL